MNTLPPTVPVRTGFGARRDYRARTAQLNLFALERVHPVRNSYADGSYFDKYTQRDWHPPAGQTCALFDEAEIVPPFREDRTRLRESVEQHGRYDAYLQPFPAAGSISYVNNSTASIRSVAAKIEIREEGKLGRADHLAPHMTNDNPDLFEDAYEIGYEKVIDTYAAATRHVDQGISPTPFFRNSPTTLDIETLYYIRLRQAALNGTEAEDGVSCAL